MVWAGVSMKGKTNLIFFENGIKINTGKYIEEVLEYRVKDLDHTMFNNEGFVFQQDSAPPHKANVAQKWCNEHLPGLIRHDKWPSYSSGLNTILISIRWEILFGDICRIQFTLQCVKTLKN